MLQDPKGPLRILKRSGGMYVPTKNISSWKRLFQSPTEPFFWDFEMVLGSEMVFSGLEIEAVWILGPVRMLQ